MALAVIKACSNLISAAHSHSSTNYVVDQPEHFATLLYELETRW